MNVISMTYFKPTFTIPGVVLNIIVVRFLELIYLRKTNKQKNSFVDESDLMRNIYPGEHEKMQGFILWTVLSRRTSCHVDLFL